MSHLPEYRERVRYLHSKTFSIGLGHLQALLLLRCECRVGECRIKTYAAT